MNINEQFELQQKELAELKAQVNELLIFGNLMKVNLGYSNDPFCREYIAIWNKAKDKTPEQCLNSVKASAVQEYIDSFDGNCTVKVYKSWIKKDGRSYANKLRGTQWKN